MTRNKSFQFRSRGNMLYAQKWWPKTYPRAVLVFVHTWGEHGGRSAEAAQYLSGAGYAAYTFDFEGHGQSGGEPRAHIASFQDWVADLSTFINTVQSELRSVPIFLCGFGVGGCVIAHYLTQDGHGHEIDGAIFNASALVVSRKLSKAKVLLAWLVGGLLPRLPIAYKPPGQMSSVLAEQRAYDEDPLVYHGKITAGTGKELLLAHLQIGARLERISTPLLVLQGTADTLVAPEGGTAVHRQAASTDKTLQMYDGAKHDLFHESNKLAVFNHVRDWLDARTGTGA